MAEFVVGIDLGTTNSVCAYSPVDGVELDTMAISQLVGPAEVAALQQLPSCLYLPQKEEFAEGATLLPWREKPGFFLGHFAVQHGAKVPGRTVLSAKSWLSYAGVDRNASILPWGGAEDVAKISPVAAATSVLHHLSQAWNHQHPGAKIEDQEVILTVPASFDEVARNLTAAAAKQAGLGHARLVEEPQAAFYNFLCQNEKQLLHALGESKVILVLDVGGGTSDFTLVRVKHSKTKPPAIERFAVGDHLMLGGDNMDAAVGRHVEQQLTGSIGSLGAAQWGSLVQSSRLAKEALLSQQPPEEFRVVIPGRGTRLIGGGKSHKLAQSTAQELLLDGFFPMTQADAEPKKRNRSALSEFSLPYAEDAAISRHICGFLRRHQQAAAEAGARIYQGLPRPDAVLLNGGVFNSAAIQTRLVQLFEHWFPGDPPRMLDHGSLDLSVARGAAYYGLVRRGFGVRIGGGSARAYYVGVEADRGGQQALCVAPRGMLEGDNHTVDRTFKLRLNTPVSFPLFTSTHARPSEQPTDTAGLTPLPPLQTVLQAQQEVPVRLQSQLTEVGTLELSLKMTPEALDTWDLTFSTRTEQDSEQQSVDTQAAAPDKNLDQAKELIERYFGNKTKGVQSGSVKNLRKQLEQLLGSRDQWSIALNRELFGALLVNAKRRRRSSDHERIFFQLSGHCLRPGFGAPFDDWRMGELWQLFEPGVQYVKDKPNWANWWLMWRRACGGLSAEQQQLLFQSVWPWLDPKSQGKKKGPRPHGDDEMIRLLASLERLSADNKEAVGTWILRRLAKGAMRSWWPIGRLGARQPFAGSAHDVVSIETAENWLSRLLGLHWKNTDGAAFAAVQLARRCGDRERDIDDKVRDRVAQKLKQIAASDDWIQMVREVVPLTAKDEAQVFGDSLPVGLKLE